MIARYFIAAIMLSIAAFPFPAPAQNTPAQQALNVHDKGVKCDGVTDDAAAFNAALVAASHARNGPGAVFVPPSKTPCLLGSPLLIQSGETLYAQPGTATIAPVSPYPDPSRNPLLVMITNVSGVTIRGLTFDGNVDRVGTSGSVITVYEADHVLFDHIAVQNTRGVAISFSGGQRGITYSGVQNSSFTNTGSYYLRTGDKKQDRRQAVAFCCGQQDAAGNYTNQHNFAKSNTFGLNGFDNLSFGQQSWFTAMGNHFGGTRNGGNIYCSHNSHLRIINNVGRGAAGNGIDCFVNSDLTIIGNDSASNGAAGIQLAETQCGLVTNNTTMNNFQSKTPGWSASHSGTEASRHRGGITIGGEKSDHLGTSDVTISGNVSGDSQSSPTQAFGIEVRESASVKNLSVSSDNRLSGNVSGAYGEQLSSANVRSAGAPSCKLWAGDN